MERATTKADLISSGNANFEKLNALIESMPRQLEIPFDFSNEQRKLNHIGIGIKI